MNIILLKESDFDRAGRVILSGRRAAHIISTIKPRIGEELSCGAVNGNLGKGLITDMTGSLVKMEVSLDRPPPAPLPLTLVLALPRPKMLGRIMESASALGVKSIYLVNSWRVEKSFWQSPALSESRLEKVLYSGLEQAGDSLMPRVHKRRFFTDFVKKELPDIAGGTLRIAAHPGTKERFPVGVENPVTCVVGPEGGFIDIEIKTLEEQGFRAATLGNRILRVETAVPFIVSRLFSHLF
ncbi:MAG: 16S rRNA (uracil(1498)-N(3))-methyltransferase [Desulfobacteraceae bacterium]